MKNLCNLPYEERRRLARNTEKFFAVAKQYNVFKESYHKLLREVGNKYKLELWVLITGTAQALKYNNTRFTVPNTKKAYTSVRKHTKQNISFTRMKSLISILEERDYVEFYNGYYFSDDDRMSSFVDLKAKWVSLFDKTFCKDVGISRTFNHVEVLRTDWEYDYIKGTKKKIKEELPTRGLRGIKRVKDDLVAYNLLITNTKITLRDQLITNIIYKRTFEIDLTGHGRYYTLGGFQSEKSEDRVFLEIKGEKCCEIDLFATQPSLLYSMAGVKMPDNYDPYKLNSDFGCDKKELRSFCKVALLCILFNATRKAASSAIVKKLRDDMKSNKPEFKSLHEVQGICKKVVEGLLETNKAIKDQFFQKNLWMKLQNMDAKICEYIVNHFTAKGICILSIHDSWVCQQRYKTEMIQIMEEAWKHVVGDEGMNFKYDIKFEHPFSKKILKEK